MIFEMKSPVLSKFYIERSDLTKSKKINPVKNGVFFKISTGDFTIVTTMLLISTSCFFLYLLIKITNNPRFEQDCHLQEFLFLEWGK